MRVLAFLCFLLPLCILADEKKGDRTCRILFLGASEEDPDKLFLHDGIVAREVELPRLNLSKVYEIPGGALNLKMLAALPADGQPPASSAPSATVSETTGDFYLLVTPDPANKAVPVRMQVIDAAVDRFKPGQMLWFNLSDNDVGGQVGKQKVLIKGRSKQIVEPPASRLESYAVNLSFRIKGKDELYPLCETQWNHDPDARTILFVVNEAGSRTPRVVGFPDDRTRSGKQP